MTANTSNDTLHPLPEPANPPGALLSRSSDPEKFVELGDILGDLHFTDGNVGRNELQALVSHPSSVCFLGDRIGLIFRRLYIGAFELVILPHPELPDEDTAAATREAIMLMMTHTDCLGLLARVPSMNVVSRKALVATGFEQAFNSLACFVLRYDKWAFLEPRIADTGETFHVELSNQGATLSADGGGDAGPVAQHSQFAAKVFSGLMVVCALSGMADKGVWLFNRWALFMGRPRATVAAKDPVVLDIGLCRVELTGDGVRVLAPDA